MRLKLALLVVPSALAVLAVAASPVSAIAKPQTFSLLSVEGTGSEIGGFDFQREPVPGDRFAFTDQLYKWAGVKRGAHVGHDEGLCTFTKVNATSSSFHATAQCVATFFLPGGQVEVEGVLPIVEGPLNFVVPVIGGTGVYANARGTAHVRDLGNGNSGKQNNEFHLLP
jgi:Allene oxide cyclase barrel like domain